MQQRQQDTLTQKHTSRSVRYSDANAHWTITRFTGYRHQATHTLNDLIHPRAITVRPLLAKARNTGIHQARINLPQRFIVHTQAVFHITAKVLNNHIRFGCHTLKQFLPRITFQVDSQRAFVAMQILLIRTMSRTSHRGSLRTLTRWRLNLDHISTPVRQ